MPETKEIRLKRMRMRAWHRGTKEMDMILGGFADAHLLRLSDIELDQLDALMEENDQDLYQWVSGQLPAPDQHAEILKTIADFTHKRHMA